MATWIALFIFVFIICFLMVNAEDIAYTQPPRYVIDCNVEARPPHFFVSATIKSILKFNKIREERLFGHDFEIYDKDKGFEAIHYSFDGIKNHFIAALHASFMHHLPFQLRPDDIWIIIAQGIANHITQNADNLRKTMVDFEDKQEIKVRDDNLDINSNNNDWSNVLNQFEAGCRNITNHNIVDLITCDFSTTSLTTKTASQCVLFKTLSKYINFDVETFSGIPEIILVGSINDWTKIQTKLKKLETMNIGLGFWLTYLQPVIDNIVETVDRLKNNMQLSRELINFWDSIYKFKHQSGGPGISGWAKTLFPYLINRKNKMIKNFELDFRVNYGFVNPSSVKQGHFPSSYSKCPMKWQYFDVSINGNMYGGIFGVAQQKETGIIAPIIGWVFAGQNKTC